MKAQPLRGPCLDHPNNKVLPIKSSLLPSREEGGMDYGMAYRDYRLYIGVI